MSKLPHFTFLHSSSKISSRICKQSRTGHCESTFSSYDHPTVAKVEEDSSLSAFAGMERLTEKSETMTKFQGGMKWFTEENKAAFLSGVFSATAVLRFVSSLQQEIFS